MEIRDLDSREAIRGAIECHGRAWQEAYADIVTDAVLERVTVDPEPAEVDTWLDRLPGDDDPGFAYGASVGRAVRGYILVRWADTKPFVDPSDAGLKEVYVHPDWWGGGLGTELLGAAVEAVPTDVAGLSLETLADNDIGRSFYESRGFVVDSHSQIEIGNETYETVIYRRPVDDSR